jgi:VWFA-related protein
MQTFGTRLLMAVVVAAAVGAYAQDTQGQANPQIPVNTGTVIKTETRLVVVDAVVTDKKDNYVKDLRQKDFKVYEDGKDQSIKTFSFEADPSSPLNNQKHYLVLLFDNSTMNLSDQARARQAAEKFIDKNAGPNRLMAIVNFSGSLEMAQNFTDDADRLRQVVHGVKLPALSSNPANGGARLPGLAGFGARNMILGLQSLAKGMQDVPGRKILVLLTAGLPLTNEVRYDIESAVSVCNRANVAVYPIDVRGLFSDTPSITSPGGRGRGPGGALLMPSRVKSAVLALADGLRPAIQPVAFTNSFAAYDQAGRGGGASGGGANGGGATGGGAAGGSRTGSGSTGAGAGTTGGSRTGAGSTGTGSPGTGRTGGVTTSGAGANGGSRGGGGGIAPRTVNPNTGMRMGNPNIIPPFPPFAGASQQALYMLADGTGGFVIVNNNDLLAGLEKIGAEQNQFYIIGYAPAESAEGTCHTLNVKVEHGYKVRSRSGYCNVKSADLLSGKPTELQLETRIQGAEPGDLVSPAQVTYFFTGPDTARVDLAMDIPSDKLKFEKVKGKLHSDINILGLAYKPDGTIGARFSDTLKLEAEDKKEIEKITEKPLHYQAQFDAASGDYTFKIAFTANGGADFGKLSVPLNIEPFDGKEFRMSSVLLSDNIHRIGPEDLSIEADLVDGRTPFIAISGGNSFQITPAGKVSFKKTDSVVCYLEAFEPLLATTNELKLGAQLRVLDKTGAAKLDSGTVEVTNYIRKGNPTVPIALKVPVDKLDAGSYKLEMTVLDSAGKSVKKTTSLTVE